MELFVLSVCLLFVPSLVAGGFEHCSKENTFGYEYLHFIPVESLNKPEDSNNQNPSVLFEFTFYVKAFSDAHILLADSNKMEDMSAYEIVIGGGKNSFSQIRLYPKDARTTQPTKDIVSALEYRGFWIKIKPHGLIIVGKMGDTDPFLFWINNKPFPIRYISFTTWTNVVGEWYFACKGKIDSETGEGDVNMTASSRLKNDLLTFYNPAVIPHKEGEPGQTVKVHLEATYFHLNEKHGELTVNGMANLKWKDWKLVWDPTQYEGLDYIHVTPFQIWTPNIRVLNSLAFDKKSLLTLNGGAVVSNVGDVFWTVPFHSVTLCILGYKNWPFDVHNCSLVFGFWTEPLKIDVEDMGVSKISRSEWEIQRMAGRDLTISSINDYDSVIDISFRRRDPTYEFLLLPPFLGAAMLSFVSFWLYPNSSTKLFLNCGSILLMIAILMSVGDRAPIMSSSSPKIVLLYSWSVIVECVPIMLFVALKYVPDYVALPRMVSTVLNSSIVEILLFLPESSEKHSDYSHLREQEQRTISAVRLITLVERFIFIIYFTVLIVPFLLFLFRLEKF